MEEVMEESSSYSGPSLPSDWAGPACTILSPDEFEALSEPGVGSNAWVNDESGIGADSGGSEPETSDSEIDLSGETSLIMLRRLSRPSRVKKKLKSLSYTATCYIYICSAIFLNSLQHKLRVWKVNERNIDEIGYISHRNVTSRDAHRFCMSPILPYKGERYHLKEWGNAPQK